MDKSPINELLGRITQIPMSTNHFVQILDIARDIEKKEKEHYIQTFIDGGDHEALHKSDSVRQDAEDYFDKKFKY